MKCTAGATSSLSINAMLHETFRVGMRHCVGLPGKRGVGVGETELGKDVRVPRFWYGDEYGIWRAGEMNLLGNGLRHLGSVWSFLLCCVRKK